MLQHVANTGHAIARRFVEEPTNLKLPAWAGLIALGDFIIFFPIFLFLGYTIGSIFPTLAIVEDPNPPAYEPVALDETADHGPEASVPGKPITTSLRATRRLLGSVAGWRSYFRGIVCAAVLSVAEASLGNIFTKFLPLIPIGALLAQLALTQLGAAWTHIVISAPSSKKFYQRLPPFKKTFEATCFPILAVWLANAVNFAVPALVGRALGLAVPGRSDPEIPENPPQLGGDVAWKSLIVFILAVGIQLAAVVPANVLLVRVQASLLPPDEDTIVPFDRSFGGKVDPVVVSGKGFVSMRDALATFPKASWVRLYKLYAKIVGITFAVYVFALAVIVPEVILILAKSEKTPSL
ncbi:putative ubiquitin conjugating protein [Echria macrotheca]|uniref:Ubiquitin conjugating protein n=1 Tax=Echria macrotheca TaxID=438768 RepID=A0AAJ0BDM0_9PEZI|nr:putative ubiquitin conjugating protein [Echria macrotheca]